MFREGNGNDRLERSGSSGSKSTTNHRTSSSCTTTNTSSPVATIKNHHQLNSRSVVGQQLQNELERELIRRGHNREPCPQDFHRQRIRRSFSIPEAKDLDVTPVNHSNASMPSSLFNARSQPLPTDMYPRVDSLENFKRSQMNSTSSPSDIQTSKTSPWLRFPEKLSNFSLSVNSLSASWAGGSLAGRSLMALASGSFDFMKTPAEDIASQLTLLDIPVFKAITEHELVSIAWNTSRKQALTPNVVAFTRRFNQVSFWVVEEILLASTKRPQMVGSNKSSGRGVAEAEAKLRADIIIHFIRISKKLFDLNNLHSCYAIVSALNSSPIYRLSKTWSCVSKKEKLVFDTLAKVFNDEANFENLRAHCSRVSLPCIPYLGMFLRDLVYVDIAHPKNSTGHGLNGNHRDVKMDSILKIIRHFQLSSYDSIDTIGPIKEFLSGVRYIEELQKFLEEDNYKMSLKLEPPPDPKMSGGDSKYSNSRKTTQGQSTFYLGSDYSSTSVLQAKSSPLPSISVSTSSGTSAGSDQSASMPGHYKITTGGGKLFVPCHRKSRSLGNNVLLESFGRDLNLGASLNVSSIRSSGKLEHGKRRSIDEFGTRRLSTTAVDTYRGRRLIDDSVVEEPMSPTGHGDHQEQDDSSIRFNAGIVNMAFNRSTESGTSSSIPDENDSGFTEPITIPVLPEVACKPSKGGRASQGPVCTSNVVFEGYVKRKTIEKDGKKPAISAWIRYWLQLSDNVLVYHPPKTLRGTGRQNFRSTCCKQATLTGGGWKAMRYSDRDGEPLETDSFYLSDPTGRNKYRFKCPFPSDADAWIEHLNRIGDAGHVNCSGINMRHCNGHGRLRAMSAFPGSVASNASAMAATASLKCLVNSSPSNFTKKSSQSDVHY